MQKNLKIAVVADWLTNQGGAEKVVADILTAFPNADLYTSIYNAKAMPQFAKYKPKTSFIQHLPFAKTKHQLYLSLMPYAFENFDLSAYDIVISSSFACSKGVITKVETLHICYCHTPMRYVWGNYIDFINKYKFPKVLKLFTKFPLHKIRIWDYLAAQRVDKFIANSSYIQKRIQKFYGAKSVVLNPGIPKAQFSNDKNPGKSSYYLAVGRLKSHKHFELIVKAFNKTQKNLVIIGTGEMLPVLKQLNTSPNTKLLGFVSRKTLENYFAHAKAFIFPQIEDFGIVQAEAQSYGVPVIAYNKGGIRDSLIDGKTGILFDEQTVNCLNQAIEKLDRIDFDRQYIKNHAKEFESQKFIEKFKKIVNTAYVAHKEIYN